MHILRLIDHFHILHDKIRCQILNYLRFKATVTIHQNSVHILCQFQQERNNFQ
jgi:hypothetical protein